MTAFDPEAPDELPRSGHCVKGKRTVVKELNCLPGPLQGILAERLQDQEGEYGGGVA